MWRSRGEGMPVSSRRFSREPVASVRAALWAVALTLVLPMVAAAQTNDDCLSCHSDAEATGEKAGQQISVYVDPEAYAGSVHGEFACTDCHADLDGAELPHAEELQPADCSTCHDDVASELTAGPHGRLPAEPGEPSAL